MNHPGVSFVSAPRPVVAFDGDDTLWVDSRSEQDWEREFQQLAADRLPSPKMADDFRSRLAANGYTIDGVRRSLLESARAACGDDVPDRWLEQVDALPDLCARLDIIPAAGVETVESLAREGREIWIITKGDVIRQSIKLARFGRAHLFSRIEIVPRKNRAAYDRILKDAGMLPRDFTMVGDSLLQDVLPAYRIGASAVHVPAGKWALTRPLERLVRFDRLRGARNLAVACDLCQAAYFRTRNRAGMNLSP